MRRSRALDRLAYVWIAAFVVVVVGVLCMEAIKHPQVGMLLGLFIVAGITGWALDRASERLP